MIAPVRFVKNYAIFLMDFLFKTRHFLTFLHEVISFKANCKSGCPCDSFECDHLTTTPTASTTQITTITTAATATSTTAITTVATSTASEPSKEAVLLLSAKYSSNVPMVIDFEGKIFKVQNI